MPLINSKPGDPAQVPGYSRKSPDPVVIAAG